VDKLSTLWPLESVSILGLSVVLREAHSKGAFQVWYHSIDIHSILFHVEFEDGLSISVLKNGNWLQNLQLEIVKKSLSPSFFSNGGVLNSWLVFFGPWIS
jgi:hypothetical protein